MNKMKKFNRGKGGREWSAGYRESCDFVVFLCLTHPIYTYH